MNIKYISTTFLLLILLVANSIAADKPNIILIMADDLGSADMSYLGSDIRTPNIDSLFKNGVSCAQAYTTAPVCVPQVVQVF